MNMRLLLFAFTFILVSFYFSKSQTPDLASLIEDAKKNQIATAASYFFEFNSDWKRAVVKPNGKTHSQTFELVCSKKRCEHIQIEKDGENLSDRKIRKNREKASKNIIKSEQAVENQPNKVRRQYGYSFMIGTVFSKKSASRFSPYLYLKTCRMNFIEKQSIDNRPTVKIRADKCNIDGEPEQEGILFMPKTEAVIWIDESDRAVVKLEVYGKPETEAAADFNKPLVIMETAKVPQGGWFWKKITISANDNQYFFPTGFGNWQIDFFNYKKFNVDINKAEVDKQPN